MDRILFKIKTFGCKVNQYESQAMREALLCAGYKEAEVVGKADLYIVNTCTVTAKADKESREALRQYLRENPDAEVVATGCYVEADSKALKAIDRRIRLVSNKEKIPKYGISSFKGRTKAFVKVQDGCNNFCSYCKVPYVRGGSRSRDPQEMFKEAKRLVKNGYKELILTGICLGDFGKDLDGSTTLAWLIKEIADIEGDFRIRLSSIELPDLFESLINLINSSEKVCNHLHIPLQSGDDGILKKMNRRYTSGAFIDKIDYIRSRIPDIAVTTDVIVGFPTESDLNFKNTIKTLRRIRPSRTHIFTYSPRKGTKAFAIKDDVRPDLKKERHIRLKELTDKLAEEFKSASSKKKQRVLVEDTRDKNTDKLTGYTDTYIKVLFDGPDKLMGKFLSLVVA